MGSGVVRVMTEFNEDSWWGSCVNTFHEEQKQFVYAKRMGMQADWTGAHPPTYDVGGIAIVDIGGGPVSLLLKCVNIGSAKVIDPGRFPQWTIDRYLAHGITYERRRGEDITERDKDAYDEVWIYNVLQHTDDPAAVIRNARNTAPIIRLFEWIDLPVYDGHPQALTKDGLEEWLEQPGFTAQVDENGAVGRAFYGVFAT